ncbi:hypothetical protein ABZY57_11055 [Streptomyces sp. NPDC006450]
MPLQAVQQRLGELGVRVPRLLPPDDGRRRYAAAVAVVEHTPGDARRTEE